VPTAYSPLELQKRIIGRHVCTLQGVAYVSGGQIGGQFEMEKISLFWQGLLNGVMKRDYLKCADEKKKY